MMKRESIIPVILIALLFGPGLLSFIGVIENPAEREDKAEPEKASYQSAG